MHFQRLMHFLSQPKVIRIKFQFYRQTGKSDSTLSGKLAGEIFFVLTCITLFYETFLRVYHFGMFVLFFRLCARSNIIHFGLFFL